MDKVKLRKLHTMIPVMTQASLVNQALHLSRVVASTFEPSDLLRKLLGGVPPAYREKILACYGETMLKAFQTGLTCPATLDKVSVMSKEDMWKHLRANFGIPKDSQDSLMQNFRETIKKYLPAIAEEGKVMMQVQTDLNNAYLEGVAELCQESKSKNIAGPTTLETDPALSKPKTEPVPEVPAESAGVPSKTNSPEADSAAMAPGQPGLPSAAPGEQSPGMPAKAAAAPGMVGKEPEKKKPDPDKAEVVKKLEYYCKLLGDPVAEKVLRYTLGLPVVAAAGTKKVTKEILKSMLTDESFRYLLNHADDPDIVVDGKDGSVVKIYKLQEDLYEVSTAAADDEDEEADAAETLTGEPDQHTEPPIALPDGEPEMPPKLSSGSMAKVGPYDVEELRAKVAGLLKRHHLAETDLQVVPVDCLVSGISQLSDDQLGGLIAKQLGQDEDMGSYLGGCDLEDAKEIADMIAEDITEQMMFPGEFMFLDVDDSYCLCFCFEKSKADEIGVLTQAVITAATKKKKPAVADGLPEGPGGSLPADELKQCQALKSFKSLRDFTEFKTLKTCAPKLAQKLGSLLTDVRNSKATIKELCDFLKAPMAEVIEQSYGSDARKAISASAERQISDYDITDHGVENSQYFQGAGTSGTKWEMAVTGVGSSEKEALEGALELLADAGWDTSALDKEVKWSNDEIPDQLQKAWDEDDDTDLYYHVSVRVK